MARVEKKYVRRLGLAGAAKEALFITSPLLTAAALSLAGVVAGAPKQFKWPGVTLLLLVATSMILILSIQLGYSAVQFRYTRADVEEDIAVRGLTKHTPAEVNAIAKKALDAYTQSIRHAIRCFDAGTLMLGLGISAALVPRHPFASTQSECRTGAAVLVLVCTVGDGLWIAYERRH